MTLTRALAETKLIKDKLNRILQQGQFVALTQGQGERKKITSQPLVGKSLADAEQQILSSFQSAQDLIRRYQALKKAIILANATTMVTIGKQTMTIAEAIERKNSIELERSLLQVLRQQALQHQQAVEKRQQMLTEAIDNGVAQLYGSDRTKITEDQLAVVRNAKLSDFEPALLDPLNIQAKIESLTESVEDFLNEVNFSLSEVNAQTMIDC